MAQIETSEYVVRRVDQLEEKIRGNPGLRAAEHAGTVIALGAVTWIGFKMYDVASDIILAQEEGLRGIKGYISPIEVQVNPAALTDEALGIMRVKWAKESRFNLIVKTYKFKEIQGYMTGGKGRLTTSYIRFMKEVEDHLVKVGYIQVEETTGKQHILDRAASFVLETKTFPALVLGFALIPILPVVGGMLRKVVKTEGKT